MSKPPSNHKTGAAKDMYWFAHGGIEANTDQSLPQQVNATDVDDESTNDSLTYKPLSDNRGYTEELKPAVLPKDLNTPHLSLNLGHNAIGLSSLDREDRPRTGHSLSRKYAVEDRRKQIWEAEQERNEALMKKHLEREAAFEARRNAQRSHISLAFGSSVPRNLEPTQSAQAVDFEKISRFPPATSGLSQKSDESYEPYLRSICSPLSSGDLPCLSGNTTATLVDGTSSLSPLFTQSVGSCGANCERKALSPPCWLVGSGAVIGEDLMSRSMTASMYAPRGRRKNDLTPTMLGERNNERNAAPPRSAGASSSFNRKRSVSMTRLDQLAQPRKHYVEANKANSTASSGASSMQKDTTRSPRPLSSASEKSGLVSSGCAATTAGVNRRARTSPKKPRPMTIAGTVPDQRPSIEVKVSHLKKSYTPVKRASPPAAVVVKKDATHLRSTPVKNTELSKSGPRPNSEKPSSHSSNEKAASKHMSPRPTPPKKPTMKQTAAPKTSSPKTPTTKKSSTTKKPDVIAANAVVPAEASVEDTKMQSELSPAHSPTPDSEGNAEIDKNNSKRIISEEEAKAALAEKRKLAREQAEKEAELERQRLENLRLEEEQRLREEEEEQKRMEDEQLRLLEEHRKQEEEKLKKAIEEQERKEEEEKSKKEEELRMKTEQEKKAKEEAEKQRIELEDKLRKEEEERAERKKRLEKIMSRTRGGKASGTSPSGSISGSDQLDSGENPHELDSSGANSLDSDVAADLPSEVLSLEEHAKTEPSSIGDSLEANPTYEVESESESLNVNDNMPSSETASQDNSMIIHPDTAEELGCAVVEKPDIHKQLTEKITEVLGSEELVDQRNQQNVAEDPLLSEKELVVRSTPFEPDISKRDNLMANTDSFSHKDSLPGSIMTSNQGEMIRGQEILQYEDGFVKPMETIQTENSTVNLPFFHPGSQEGDVGQRSRDSTSSDLKLPDPIYEMTSSDEGSVSSERHQKETSFGRNELSNFGFGEPTAFNMPPVSDDVFSEQDISHTDANLIDNSINPFAVEDSQFTNVSYFENTLSHDPNETNSILPGDHLLDQRIVDEEKSENLNPFANGGGDVPSQGSIDVKVSDSSINPFFQSLEQSEFGTGDNSVLHLGTFDSTFGSSEPQDLEHSTFNTLENQNFTLETSTVQHFLCSDAAQIKSDNDSNTEGNSTASVNNPITSDTTDFDKFSQQALDDCNKNEQINIPKQASDIENPGVDEYSSSVAVGNVTVITDKDSGGCIGIISSVDQAQTIPPDFSKTAFNNEHFNNIYENRGATDSEDNSSLDSNLSQVIDVNNEERETNDGLKNTETSNGAHDRAHFETSEQYFSHVPPVRNGNLKSNGKPLMCEDTITNGHRNESSELSEKVIESFPNYSPLEKVKGNDISSVDHPKDNIFENVDAIDFSKVDPDPFPAKGNSKPVSGNPFLM